MAPIAWAGDVEQLRIIGKPVPLIQAQLRGAGGRPPHVIRSCTSRARSGGHGIAWRSSNGAPPVGAGTARPGPVELTRGLWDFGRLAGEALHEGLEARGIGGNELRLDVGDLDAICGHGSLVDRARAASRALAVYLSPRTCGWLVC
jgi:hypothetical protein